MPNPARLSPEGVAFLHGEESFRPFAYPDPYSPLAKATRHITWGYKNPVSIIRGLPADVKGLSGKPWTVGYGQTKGITIDSYISHQDADAKFAEEVAPYENAISKALKVPTSQNQFDAMVALAWNIGIAGFLGSTVLKAHNAGNFLAASRAFGLWNKVRDENDKLVESAGLTSRRQREANLYLRNIASAEAEQKLAQAEVEPERPVSQSEISKAAVSAGGVASLAAIVEAVKMVADAKESVESIADMAVPLLMLVIVALCAYVVWQRVRVRKEGWS